MASSLGSKFSAFWNHPAGPKTIFFWAPTMKWGITAANINDFSRPVEGISYPQQLAVTLTGVIWTRYSVVINPVRAFRDTSMHADVAVNYNLMTVNMVMATTGMYQLARKIQADYMDKKP